MQSEKTIELFVKFFLFFSFSSSSSSSFFLQNYLCLPDGVNALCRKQATITPDFQIALEFIELCYKGKQRKATYFVLHFELSPCAECCIPSFWVIPQRLNFMCRRFETLCSIFIGGVSFTLRMSPQNLNFMCRRFGHTLFHLRGWCKLYTTYESPASEFYMQTFRNTVPSSQVV